MELIKSMEWAGGGKKDAEKRERKFARAGSLPARFLLTRAGIRVLAREGGGPKGGNREEHRRARRDGGAEMFSVDCSPCQRKFALSFSL